MGYADEEQIKSQVLALSCDQRNFLVDPPPGAQFPFDYSTYSSTAVATMAADPALEQMRYNLVPKKCVSCLTASVLGDGFGWRGRCLSGQCYIAGSLWCSPVRSLSRPCVLFTRYRQLFQGNLFHRRACTCMVTTNILGDDMVDEIGSLSGRC